MSQSYFIPNSTPIAFACSPRSWPRHESYEAFVCRAVARSGAKQNLAMGQEALEAPLRTGLIATTILIDIRREGAGAANVVREARMRRRGRLLDIRKTTPAIR